MPLCNQTHAQSQVLQHPHGGVRLVEGIKVDAWRAGAQQVFALLGGILNAELGHGGIVVAQFFQFGPQRRRDAGATQRGEALDLRPAQDRHDAGYDGNPDVVTARHVVAKFIVVRVVKKQLSDDPIGARVNLSFQVTPIHVLAFFAGDVTFGKTGDADAEIVLFSNEPDQLAGKFEASGRGLELAAAGRVAAQGQDIADAQRANLAEEFADLLAGGIDASQVGHAGQAVLPLDAVDDPQRLVAGAASGAVSHRAIIGPGLQQRRQRFLQQVALALVGLWRKELKRDHRAPGAGLRGIDVPNKLHETSTCANLEKNQARRWKLW